MKQRKPKGRQVTDFKAKPAKQAEALEAAFGGKSVDLAMLENAEDAESTARVLRTLIRSNILGPKDKLQAHKLAEGLGIHRNTVSRALGLLEEEGYLSRKRGRSAQIVSGRARVEQRPTVLSLTEVAQRAHLEIATIPTRAERCALSTIHQDRKPRVARHLQLASDADVVIVSRVRSLVGESTGWRDVPALAETAYFRPDRLPSLFLKDMESGAVDSIGEYLQASHVRVVRSRYRIRIAPLPDNFVDKWAEMISQDTKSVRSLWFLRFENTVHSDEGPVEYSISYLRDDLFSISATQVEVEIRLDGLIPPRPAGDRSGS